MPKRSRALGLLTEAQVQEQIVSGLRALGYVVLVTSARSFRAGEAGRGYGADKGVPDLLVRHRSWPPAAWLAMEVKKPRAWRWSSDEQRRLWEERALAKVHSWEEACYAIAHAGFGGAPAEVLVASLRADEAGVIA